MSNETIPLFKVYMDESAAGMVAETLNSGFISQGKKVDDFEASLKVYFKYPWILSLNSATSGLTLAYKLYDVTAEDNVVSTPLTCFAGTSSILASTDNIVWADSDSETCNINLKDAKNKINVKTKVISFVHWGGVPVDLDQVWDIQDYAYQTFGTTLGIVQDCAHAFSTKWDGGYLGTDGRSIAVYSLQAIKHLTCGDGGLIFLPDQETYDRAKRLRWFGIDRNQRSKPGSDFRLEPDIPEYGYKYHMNDINATIGLANMNMLDERLDICRSNADYYNRSLCNLNEIQIFYPNDKANPCYWIYTLKVKRGRKPQFLEYMKENNIVVSQVHARNDKNSCVKKCQVELPLLDKVEKEIVSIPVGWWVTDTLREYIVNCITEFDKKYTYNICPMATSHKREYYDIIKEYSNIYTWDKSFEIEDIEGIFVIVVNSTVVSCAKLIIEKKIYNSLGHIEDVVTHCDYRGCGYGKELVKWVTQHAFNSGCYKVMLHSNDDLQYFYESCGLKKSGISFEKRRFE